MWFGIGTAGGAAGFQAAGAAAADAAELIGDAGGG